LLNATSQTAHMCKSKYLTAQTSFPLLYLHFPLKQEKYIVWLTV